MLDKPTIPDTTDVVVIGGGIIGASATFFLASETPLDVTLVEQSSIGSGSTGDSSAIIRHHYGTQEIYSRMAKWSHDFYRSFEDRTGEQMAYNPNPRVRFAQDGTVAAEYARAGYDILKSLDIPVSHHERNEFPEQYPMLDIDEYDFAVSDDEAAYSDAADVAAGLVRAAQREGATVVTNTSVTDIETADGSIAGVETESGSVDTEAVLVAAGPWTPDLVETVGLTVPITPSREQIVILDLPEEFKATYSKSIPTSGLPDVSGYFRSDFGDGVLVATHYSGEEVDPDQYDTTPDEDVMLELIDNLLEIVPDLEQAGIKGRYCGVYSTTPDRDFVLDQAGPEGCYLACGFSGHGFKHGPVVGRIMTDLITEGDTDLVDLSYFSLDRFDGNPEGNGRPGHA